MASRKKTETTTETETPKSLNDIVREKTSGPFDQSGGAPFPSVGTKKSGAAAPAPAKKAARSRKGR